MDSEDIYKFFNDSKFLGLDKINNTCQANLIITNKFIKTCKDFYFAQDLYVKSLSKINGSLSQYSNDKTYCLNPILSFFSITFCVFTNVQNEFTASLNKVIRVLTSVCEEKDEVFGKVFTSRQLNVISDFKNAEMHLKKVKQKYFSLFNLCHGNADNDIQKIKSLKRSKELYELSVINYNKARIGYLEVLNEGFNKLKENQYAYLNGVKKFVKSFGNAMAKFVFDIKESVDSIKQFYRSFDNDEIFQSWIDSNKTVTNPYLESFPEAVIEVPEIPSGDDLLIDIDSTGLPNQSPAKNIYSRKLSQNVTGSGCNIIDQDIPQDSVSQDSNGNGKTNGEKFNVVALKGTKKKWSIFSSFMKFKSTSNLNDTKIDKIDLERSAVDDWQSRNNLNDSALVDEEGFIIRDSPGNERKAMSESSISSSSSSSGNRIKGLKKLHIKPMDEVSKKSDCTDSVLINAALQLPLPHKGRISVDMTKKTSNLQRCSRPVSYLSKEKLYRRSMSVSEIQDFRSQIDTESYNNMKEKVQSIDKKLMSIPVACAVIEAISADIAKNVYNIQGQVTIAFPLSLKQYLLTKPANEIPPVIIFKMVDSSYQITSAKITHQLEHLAKLEKIDKNVYYLSIFSDHLKSLICEKSESNSKLQSPNRVSFPVIEYLANVNDNVDKIIDCQARWAQSNSSSVQFDFILSSVWFQDNKPVIVTLKLLTEGIIEEVFSKNSLAIDKLNNHCWKINYGRSENRISVIIKPINQKVIKLRMNHEFTFENLSFVRPEFMMKNENTNSRLNFKISFMHYKSISMGNVSQVFEYNIP